MPPKKAPSELLVMPPFDFLVKLEHRRPYHPPVQGSIAIYRGSIYFALTEVQETAIFEWIGFLFFWDMEHRLK